MYRIVGRPALGFGAADTTEWWVGAGFFSQWAGDPPCPSGAQLTTGTGCQYKGIIAEKNGDPTWDTRLDQWIAKRCSEGEYVMMSEPYYDEVLKRDALKVFSGPGEPERKDIGGPNTPPLTDPACFKKVPTGSACPKGEILTANGCVPEGDLLAHLPPPCNDPDKMRQMFRDIGLTPAMPDSSYDEKKAAVVAIMKWCVENDIDCTDDQAVCDALVEGSEEARAGISAGTIVGIVAVGAVAAGAVIYLSRRKP
jgi:hypothetical protein